MDSIFGIGLPELILILLLAGLVMGPQRIRQVARSLGRLTAQLQGISREFARQLNAELDSLDDGGDVKNAMNDMRALQNEVEALRRELRQMPTVLSSDARKAVKEGEAALNAPTTKPKDETRIDGVAVPSTPKVTESPRPEADSSSNGKQTLPKAIEVPGDPD